MGDHTHACLMNVLDPIPLFYRGVEFFKFSQKEGGGGGGAEFSHRKGGLVK